MLRWAHRAGWTALPRLTAGTRLTASARLTAGGGLTAVARWTVRRLALCAVLLRGRTDRPRLLGLVPWGRLSAVRTPRASERLGRWWLASARVWTGGRFSGVVRHLLTLTDIQGHPRPAGMGRSTIRAVHSKAG